MPKLNKIFVLICLAVCTSLSGCSNQTASVAVIPAHLELEWTQPLEMNAPNTQSSGIAPAIAPAIAPERAQRLKQIGDYQSSSAITYANNKAVVNFKLKFSKEIKSDERETLIPILKSIFEGQEFQARFHGQQTKQETHTSIGLFSQTQESFHQINF